MDDAKRQTPDDSHVRNVNMKCSRFIHHSLCMLKYTLLSRGNLSLITWSSKLKYEILQRTCKIQRNILVSASFLTCHITVDWLAVAHVCSMRSVVEYYSQAFVLSMLPAVVLQLNVSFSRPPAITHQQEVRDFSS